MATENPLRFIGNEYNGTGNWLLNKDTSEFASSSNLSEDFGLLLKRKKYHGTKNNTGLSRSGSAPPSMEGSRAVFDILKTDGFGDSLVNSQSCGSEEERGMHPAYFAYYSGHVDSNPRLPPPLMSHQNQHLREHSGGFEINRTSSFDDSCKASLAISRPFLSIHDEEPEDDRSPKLECSDWADNKDDIAAGYFLPVQGHHMDAINLVQEDFPKTQEPAFNVYSHPSSNIMKLEASQDPFSKSLHDSSMGTTNSETKTTNHGVHGCTHLGSHPVGLILNGDSGAMSIPLSTSSEKTVSLLIGQHESNSGSTAVENVASTSGVIEDEIRKLRLSTDGHRSHQSCQNSQQAGSHAQSSSHSQVVSKGMSYAQGTRDHLSHEQHGQLKLPSVDVQPFLQSTGVAPLLYLGGAGYGSPYYQNLQLPGIPSPQFNLSGYALNPSLVTQLATSFPNHSAISLPFESLMGPNVSTGAVGIPNSGSIFSGVDMQQVYKLYGHLGLPVQYPFPDPLYIPFYQNPSMDAYATAGDYDSTISRDGTGRHLSGTYDIAKASSSAYLADQRPQAPIVGINVPNTMNGGPVSPSYYGSPPNIGVLVHFPNSPLTSPVFQPSPVSTPSFSGQKKDNIKFPFGSERKAASSSVWQNQRGSEKVDSFLEELKSNRARRYELTDIVGRIVEFSADQHGSRFIQQKLETCSIDEKASVFKEVLPCASSLMIDVFGNYVIQKFFEHGNTEQRKELAYKLVGNVLPLSLQMYGCRVIQKALEVIELDQKMQLVQELDGNVMRCVRDQNGNHVVQKCIQCIPTEKIDFIISAFRGQVATLSTHPYGCRVIQRVLEHCTDESQSQFIVDEILQSACLLAQDQYGNYVTQHILEKGKPHERSQIISKLSGQILQMSQHKFASNVIEKCLEYGNAKERDQLINEIVGETEASDNLMVMMKDQYANYVVQTILDTCSDEQQEILVNRVKVHLQSLKKYTYGKHIVARVEQLCGEGVDSGTTC